MSSARRAQLCEAGSCSGAVQGLVEAPARAQTCCHSSPTRSTQTQSGAIRSDHERSGAIRSDQEQSEGHLLPLLAHAQGLAPRRALGIAPLLECHVAAVEVGQPAALSVEAEDERAGEKERSRRPWGVSRRGKWWHGAGRRGYKAEEGVKGGGGGGRRKVEEGVEGCVSHRQGRWAGCEGAIGGLAARDEACARTSRGRRPPPGNQMVIKWQSDGTQMIIKWRSVMALRWQLDGNQIAHLARQAAASPLASSTAPLSSAIALLAVASCERRRHRKPWKASWKAVEGVMEGHGRRHGRP